MTMILKSPNEWLKGFIRSNDGHEKVRGKLKDIGLCNRTTICIGTRMSIYLNQNTIRVQKNVQHGLNIRKTT